MSTIPAAAPSMSRITATSTLSGPALVVLRVSVALLIGVHPCHRILHGNVGEFGTYLTSQGFPFGTGVAWLVTLSELVGVIALLTGRFVRFTIPVNVLILVTGIIMVHAPSGWFVVGGGSNGVEYSLSLIAALIAVWLASGPARDASA